MYSVLTRANGLLILIHNTCSCSVFFVMNENKPMFICHRKHEATIQQHYVKCLGLVLLIITYQKAFWSIS